MNVADLIEQLQKCDPGAPVRIISSDGEGEVIECRQCLKSGRCLHDYVELSTEDVPVEWLGECDSRQKDIMP